MGFWREDYAVDELVGKEKDILEDGGKKKLFRRLVFYLCFIFVFVFVLAFALLMLCTF